MQGFTIPMKIFFKTDHKKTVPSSNSHNSFSNQRILTQLLELSQFIEPIQLVSAQTKRRKNAIFHNFNETYF